MTKVLDIKRLNEVAEKFGATVTSVFDGDDKTYASIDFTLDSEDYSLDRGHAGIWLSRELAPKWNDAGYIQNGLTGGWDVGLSYAQLLASKRPVGGSDCPERSLERVLRKMSYSVAA